MSTVSRGDIFAALRAHAQSERLCQRAADVCLAAARAKRGDWLSARTVALDATPLTSLTPTEADTPYGNLLSILDRGAQTPLEWSVLGAALALAVARQWPHLGPEAEPTAEDRERLSQLAWLAANTGCNAWTFLSLDETVGEGALWPHLDGCVDDFGVAEQLALAVGLMDAGAEKALGLKASWLDRTGNPSLVALLETSSMSPWLAGQVRPSPRSGGVWVLQALSGYLFVKTLWRLIERYVLWSRLEAKVRVSPRGLEFLSRRHLLGRPFKERRHLIPLSELREVRRETRFRGVALYVGLAALLVGSFLGMGLLLDGLRVPGTSPSLITVGLGLLALGIGADFCLSRWSTVVQGRGELLVQRRRGRGYHFYELDPRGPDELVERVTRLRAFSTSPVAK
jgi:hypothetical protein